MHVCYIIFLQVFKCVCVCECVCVRVCVCVCMCAPEMGASVLYSMVLVGRVG